MHATIDNNIKWIGYRVMLIDVNKHLPNSLQRGIAIPANGKDTILPIATNASTHNTSSLESPPERR